MTKSKNQNRLLTITLAMLVFLIIIEFISDSMIGDSGIAESTQKAVVGLVIIDAIITFVVSVYAVYMTNRWRMAVAILSCLISLFILGAAFFAYSFAY